MTDATVLNTKPKFRRTAVARGLSDNSNAILPRVDRTSGHSRAGIIRGVSAIQTGEALGHGLWCDKTLIQQTADAVNATKKGVKARFTHPSLSSDGLGSFLGRVTNASVVGDKCVADIHFSKSSHKTPSGDLASYVMQLADDDPSSFGCSIVFEPDTVAEDEFSNVNSSDVHGHSFFQSPDGDNVNNLPHARLLTLRAIDCVDEPAANSGGLFGRSQEIAKEADELLSYSLGLSDTQPQLLSLSVDSERVKQFLNRFLQNNNLTISRINEDTMDRETTDVSKEEDQQQPALDGETVSLSEADKSLADTELVVGCEGQTDTTGDETQSQAQLFRDTFGDKAGEYYLAELTYEEARKRHSEYQQALIEELQNRLAANTAADCEDSPVSFSSVEAPVADKPSFIRIRK